MLHKYLLRLLTIYPTSDHHKVTWIIMRHEAQRQQKSNFKCYKQKYFIYILDDIDSF